MSDYRPGPSSAPPEPGEAPATLEELVDGAVRRLMTAIVIAGGLIGLALYAQGDPPRYQVTAADGRIIRINTESGTVIACDAEEHCAIVLQRGQSLDELPPRALPAPAAQPAAQPAPALPAPAAAPAPGNEAAPATR